jgi:hypothetical protein
MTIQDLLYKSTSMNNFYDYMLNKYYIDEDYDLLPRGPFELLAGDMYKDTSICEGWNRDELAEHLIRKGASADMLGTMLLAYDEYEEVKSKAHRAAARYLAQRERGAA